MLTAISRSRWCAATTTPEPAIRRQAWRVRVVGDPHPHAPFVLCHEPQHPRTGYALCGHVHPGIRLSDSSGDSARLPCFVLGRKRALLPAFGRLTGLALVTPAAGETIVAIAGARLFALPSQPA